MDIAQKLSIFFNYLVLRPSRIANIILIQLSKKLRLTRVLGKPITAMIEPTNYCNLKCPLCPTGAGLIKREKQALKLEDFKKIVGNLGSSVFHIRLWNWGEPLINKQLPEMIKYAKSKSIFVNTSTNSFFLNKDIIRRLIDSGLDQLIISLDGASEETYNKYRKKGSFKQVIDSLKLASELKKEKKTKYPEIKLQFIVMKHNEHEIKKMIELAKAVKADTLFFKTVGIMDSKLKKDINKYLPENKLFRRYMLEGTNIGEVKLKSGVCNYLWEEITINVDGSVVPCCRDAHGKYILGNIKKQKIKEIWNSRPMINFRKRVISNKNSLDICKSCSGSSEDFHIKEIRFN